jgi:hypothetical protein
MPSNIDNKTNQSTAADTVSNKNINNTITPSINASTPTTTTTSSICPVVNALSSAATSTVQNINKHRDGRVDFFDYEALGEVEAAASSQDPAPPFIFPASQPPLDKKLEECLTNKQKTKQEQLQYAAMKANKLQQRLEKRVGKDTVSRFAAIQQNPVRENPAVTEEIHKQGKKLKLNNMNQTKKTVSIFYYTSHFKLLYVYVVLFNIFFFLVHMSHEMLAGSTASVVSRFCVAPLDVLKIRFQIQECAKHQRQYKTVWQAITDIYKKEGVMVNKINLFYLVVMAFFFK